MRGQVEAPIELVVAVIIMAMSLALAFYVMNQSSRDACIKEVRGEMEKLQLAMQDLALGYAGTTKDVPVTLKGCAGEIKGMRFAYYPDPQFCRNCAGHYRGCWKLELLVSNSEGTDYKPLSGDAEALDICIDMSGEMGLCGKTSASSCLSTAEAASCDEVKYDTCPPGTSDCTTGSVPASVKGFTSPGGEHPQFLSIKTGESTSNQYVMRLKKGSPSVISGVTRPLIKICPIPMESYAP
jgi:type II secretory pathway pseudopilin PulG